MTSNIIIIGSFLLGMCVGMIGLSIFAFVWSRKDD